MLHVLLFAILPVEAPKPANTAYYAKVDMIVVSRVRSHATSYDEWGRPTHKYTEQWWVSFWETRWAPAMPFAGPVPIGWVDRGWWSCSNCKGFYPCSEGWMVESKDGMNVIARDMLIIDSPFDWEVKHRSIYQPIKKP